MKILSFDTTNNSISVALLSNKRIISEKTINESLSQSELLIPLIEECLTENNIWYQDLDSIAFTNGPGSFTGVRVGFCAAKALKLTTKLPIISINSLKTIAYDYLSLINKGSILVVMDAKLDDFFIQEFKIYQNNLKSSYNPKLIKSSEIQSYLPKNDFLLAGTAKKLIKDQFSNYKLTIYEKNDQIKAKNIAFLAHKMLETGLKDEPIDILYIRKPKISKRKG